MINKILRAYLLTVLFIWFISFSHADAIQINNKQIFLNKDGSHIALQYSARKHKAIVTLISGGKSKPLLNLKPAKSSNINFFSTVLIDIDNDGFGDIEESGDCGNRVCEKTIYRFNPQTKRYAKLFSGAYSTVQLDDGFLITGGGSGCCAHEYHVYELEQKNFTAQKNPSYIISISNLGEGRESKIECGFSDQNAKTIVPPKESWKDFCEVYGKNYKLVLP